MITLILLFSAYTISMALFLAAVFRGCYGNEKLRLLGLEKLWSSEVYEPNENQFLEFS
jgi:hypothetical protein